MSENNFNDRDSMNNFMTGSMKDISSNKESQLKARVKALEEENEDIFDRMMAFRNTLAQINSYNLDCPTGIEKSYFFNKIARAMKATANKALSGGGELQGDEGG